MIAPNDEPTVTLTMTIVQARLLSWTTDIVCRLYLNQFDIIKEVCHRRGQPFPDYHEMRDIELHLKQIFSPELDLNAYWGIYNTEVSNNARTLFDMKQKIRHELAWYSNPLGDLTVDYDSFMQTDRDNPPITVTMNTDDPNHAIYMDFFKRLDHSINQMVDKRGWRDNPEAINSWIEQCKQFALHEHQHIATTNTPLPPEDYLTFFNEYIDEKGYVRWKEI